MAALADAAPSLAKAKCSKFLQLPRRYSFFLSTSDQHFNTHPLVGSKVRERATSPEGPSVRAEAFVQKGCHRVASSGAMGTGCRRPLPATLLPPCLHIPRQGCFLVLLGSADAQLRGPLQAQGVPARRRGCGCSLLEQALPSHNGLFCCCAIK